MNKIIYKIIEGLQSQLGAVQNQQAIIQGTQAQAQAAGADVINDIAIVKLQPKEDANAPNIWARFTPCIDTYIRQSISEFG